jgi:hypothetical protein
MWRAAFFPPGLHPVLDSGEGNEDAMVAPQMPASGLIGQSILDHESDSQRHDTMGVVRFGQGVVGRVGVEVLVAPAAVMLGVDQVNVSRPTGDPLAQIVQNAGEVVVAMAALATVGTRSVREVATTVNDLCRG